MGVLWANSNPKSPNLDKFSWGGGRGLWTSSNQILDKSFGWVGYSGPTSKDLQSGQIIIFGGGALLWTNSNPKFLNLAKFSFSGGGGILWTNFKSKVPQSGFHWGGVLWKLISKVPQSGQVFIGGYSGPTQTQNPSPDQFFISGGGVLDTTFLKYLSGCTQGVLHQEKFWKPNLLLHRRKTKNIEVFQIFS